jgi:hypothetical protein
MGTQSNKLVLLDEQKGAIGRVLGKSFEAASVDRMASMAPGRQMKASD